MTRACRTTCSSAWSRDPCSTDGARWIDDQIAGLRDGGECESPAEAVTVTGGTGRSCGSAAALVGGDRGYVIVLYTSGDDPADVAPYDLAYFRGPRNRTAHARDRDRHSGVVIGVVVGVVVAELTRRRRPASSPAAAPMPGVVARSRRAVPYPVVRAWNITMFQP